MIQMLHLKIGHDFLHAKQKLMVCFLMKQIILLHSTIHIAMPMFSVIEYSDNYSDISGSLWQFKREKSLKVPVNNADFTIDTSQ